MLSEKSGKDIKVIAEVNNIKIRTLYFIIKKNNQI